MHLDDVESETAPRVEQYLSKINLIRLVAGKIIAFLAQLEDFQKKLWLKKKFVVATRYCISVGSIPEPFYPEIAANPAQRQEWVSQLGIDGIKGDLTTPAHSDPLTEAFLKANPTLMVDTGHFSPEFSARLIAAMGDLDEKTDGVLFHGENFQVLNLIQTRFREKINCAYIDPPYNTDASAIDYKNGYKASSWVSLIADRVDLVRPLLDLEGVLVSAIDDAQHRELTFIVSDAFAGGLLGTICVRSNPSGRPTKTGYSVSHEYLLFAGKTENAGIGRMPPTKEQMARFSECDALGVFEWRNLRREGSNSDRSARRALYDPIYIAGQKIRVPQWFDAKYSATEHGTAVLKSFLTRCCCPASKKSPSPPSGRTASPSAWPRNRRPGTAPASSR